MWLPTIGTSLTLGLHPAPATAKVQTGVVIKEISNLTTDQVEQPSFPSPTQAQIDASVAAVEAQKAKEAAEAAAAEAARVAALAPVGTYANNYAWGNCTAYVASRKHVPDSLGDARNWGFALGYHDQPMIGAIAWTTAGWAGHVAIVEAIASGQVQVSEENVAGLGVIDYRWVPISEFSYIYQ